MREIKFRMWDKVHKEMVIWEQYKSELVTADFTDENLVVMQNTGLKDKKGIEIYEGDIIKCTDGEDKINELNSDTGIGQVEWFEKFGFWNISNIENGLGDIILTGFVEVIGNIYEKENDNE